MSLFTDCTAAGMCWMYYYIGRSIFIGSCEMVKIMQDYGEIVCCVSSALNVDNVKIFSQADVRYRLSSF